MDFMCTNDIDVCAITETWLSNDIGDSEFLPNGYQIVRKDRDIEFTRMDASQPIIEGRGINN